MSNSDSDSSSVPAHVGIILDGNRRWAKANGKPKLEGHRVGYDNLETIGDAAWDAGVKYLSAYIFSTENWNREKEEVSYLMDLLVTSVVAGRKIKKLNEKDIKVVFVGSRENLSQSVLDAMQKAEESTKDNKRGILALHFNYGGRVELKDAVTSIVAEGHEPEEITEDLIEKYLYAPELPHADLIIRTSGEQRLSNFMMWRSAYSELYFTDKYWPDFTPEDLDEALLDYSKRQRRHGK